MPGQYTRYPVVSGSGGSGVTSLNTLTGDLTLAEGSGISITPSGGNTLTIAATGSGSGTVTSVAMTVPSFLSVSGSPITTSGTLAVTLSGTALPILNGGTGQTTANAALNAFLPSQTGNNGKFLTTDGTNTSWATAGSGSGTVTSVSLSDSTGLFTVTGSPITTSGTLTLSAYASQAQNAFLAGPSSGGAGAAAFRSIIAADIPTLNQDTTGTAANITATSNSTLVTLSVLSLPGSQVTGNISGNAANITATSNSTLTTLSALSLPTSQLTGSVLQLSQTTTPSNPPSGSNDLYFKTDNNLYILNSSGQEILVGNTGGSGSNFYASSIINTNSSAVTSSSFTTASNSPAFTFIPLVSGVYKVYASVPVANSTATDYGVVRIFNTSGSGVLLNESQAVSFANATAIATTTNISVTAISFYTLIAGTSYTFDIQLKVPGGVGSAGIQADSSNGANFYMFAELSSNGLPANPTATYWSGYFIPGNTWSVSSSTFAAMTHGSGTPTLTQRIGTMAVSAAASGAPGITFTPSSISAVYQITAIFMSNDDGQFDQFSLTDGTITITTGCSGAHAIGNFTGISINGLYSPGTISPVTIQIYGASATTASIGSTGVTEASSIEWSITRIA